MEYNLSIHLQMLICKLAIGPIKLLVPNIPVDVFSVWITDTASLAVLTQAQRQKMESAQIRDQEETRREWAKAESNLLSSQDNDSSIENATVIGVTYSYH